MKYFPVNTNNTWNPYRATLNRFATGHVYNCDHCSQTDVAKIDTNKKICTLLQRKQSLFHLKLIFWMNNYVFADEHFKNFVPTIKGHCVESVSYLMYV